MTKYIYLILGFIVLVLFDFYLKTNISGLNEGSESLSVLVLSVFIGCVLFAWKIISSSSLFVKRSTGFLVLFFAYFVLRIIIDIGSLEQLKSYTVATSGGVIFFYSMGLLISLLLNQLTLARNSTSQRYLKIFTGGAFVYLIFSFTTMFYVFSELAMRLRDDLFLIADLDGTYQRAGNFLTISFLVNTTVYMRVIALNQQCKNGIYRFLKYFIFLIYLSYTGLAVVVAQMIGSNNATVTILGLSVVFLITLLLIMPKKIKSYLNHHELSIKKIILGRIGRRAVFLLVISIVALFVLIMSIANLLGFDLLSTRLMGFGAGESSSINSRLDLLGNFIIQFSDSPFLGNMNVAVETTGNSGSYVHSFMLSSLTHLGVLGSTLLLVYLGLAYKEIFSRAGKITLSNFLLPDNVYALYSLITISFLLLIATAATFITWSVAWFAMGLFFVAIRFEKNKRFNHE